MAAFLLQHSKEATTETNGPELKYIINYQVSRENLPTPIARHNEECDIDIVLKSFGLGLGI